METDINGGLLIIGVGNTILFGGDSASELILLNLATGQDYAMPVSQEQVAQVLAIAKPDLLAEPDGYEVQNETKPVTNAWDEVEKVPQL